MIENLNKLSFQPFGSVSPAEPDMTGWELPWEKLNLAAQDHPAWRTVANTWLACSSGMAVLSISHDGVTYRDFYIDKPVKIQSGIYFSVSAFQEEAAIRYASSIAPQPLDALLRKPDLVINRKLNIEKVYTIFYQEKERGFIFPGEAHPLVELTYVDQGSLHSVADGQDLLLEQGDLMLYAPNQWHVQYADIGVVPRFMTVAFDAGDYDLSELYNRKFQSPRKAISLLQQLLQEQEKSDNLSGDMILCLLTQVLLNLQRLSDKPAEPLKSTYCLNNENDIIRRAQQYISTHIRCRLSVPLVAENADVSSSYLTALFHKHLQISPGEYIRRIKLQESKQMIREGSMNFTEIAEALQYSTIHHFSRQFKEKFGITPSQYAKSIR